MKLAHNACAEAVDVLQTFLCALGVLHTSQKFWTRHRLSREF
jgi:hypothetical protein